MKVLHLKNDQRNDGPGLRNLTKSDTEPNIYFSGFWDLKSEEADSLVGGMIFLHETKAKPSRFGGRVLAYKIVSKLEYARSQRIEFKVQSMLEGRGVKWRGAEHTMASYGGHH